MGWGTSQVRVARAEALLLARAGVRSGGAGGLPFACPRAVLVTARRVLSIAWRCCSAAIAASMFLRSPGAGGGGPGHGRSKGLHWNSWRLCRTSSRREYLDSNPRYPTSRLRRGWASAASASSSDSASSAWSRGTRTSPHTCNTPKGTCRVYDADDLRARAALRALPVGIPLRDGVTHLWRWSKPSGSHFRINW